MNTTAQFKTAIKKSAKQFADEPLELLKNARAQVTGEQLTGLEQAKSDPAMHQNKSDPEIPQDEKDYKKQKSESEGRTLQALESELKDIRRQKIFNDLVARIQNGEDVPLEEFSELSYEQKDVLKAQIEAIKTQQITSHQSQNTLIEPVAKKGRQMFGQKQSAQKQTTRVEKPVPPSG